MAGILSRLHRAGTALSYRKITILIPTRKRPAYLQRLLESYHASLTNADDSELVFRCDTDDLESVQHLAPYDCPIVVGPRREGYKSLPRFYNEMAAIATGDLLICGNDGMIFQTQGWPRLIIEEANKYPDGIFSIGVSTSLNDDNFAFSIVSRQFVQKLGKINDERLLVSDIFLLDVMKHFGRAMKLRTVAFLHDWAGHTDDQTCREANRHEFGQVFANVRGDWTEEYRERHDRVVREAIAKLDPGGNLLANQAIEIFESYQPPASGDGQPWPPSAVPRAWGKPASATAIHYGLQETKELIRVITDARIAKDQIILSSFQNGLPSILWGHLFDKVTTIFERDGAAQSIRDGKHTIAFGAVWDTRFVYQLLDQIGSFSALVLDDLRYFALISPYYLFRRNLTRPGIVILVNTRQGQDGPDASGVDRFLSDLRSGHLDGECHDIRSLSPSDGAGMSYEIVAD